MLRGTGRRGMSIKRPAAGRHSVRGMYLVRKHRYKRVVYEKIPLKAERNRFKVHAKT